MTSRRAADGQNQRALKLFAAHGRAPRVATYRDWGDLRRKLPNEVLLPRRLPVECGTDAGYEKHRRAGETPCELCRDAHARSEYERPARARKKAAAA